MTMDINERLAARRQELAEAEARAVLEAAQVARLAQEEALELARLKTLQFEEFQRSQAQAKDDVLARSSIAGQAFVDPLIQAPASSAQMLKKMNLRVYVDAAEGLSKSNFAVFGILLIFAIISALNGSEAFFFWLICALAYIGYQLHKRAATTEITHAGEFNAASSDVRQSVDLTQTSAIKRVVTGLAMMNTWQKIALFCAAVVVFAKYSQGNYIAATIWLLAAFGFTAYHINANLKKLKAPLNDQ
jgi:hypothetical protein